VDPCFIEVPDAFRVLVGVPPMNEGEQQDMTIGKWGEGNKMDLHRVVDTKVHHK
jgi:hypothetical protein